MQLESDAFEGMDCLRLLKFYVPNFSIGCNYKVYLTHGLRCLSDGLRYLHWHRFPLKSLQSNFCGENLVELNLPYSKVKQLWIKVQHLVNLKRIDLKYSKYLTKIPNLSKARNIESINLEGCKSLVKLPSSFQSLNKLDFLCLILCDELVSLPTSINSKFLKVLNLSLCSNVRKCPEILGNLEILDLSGTMIEELPPSIHKLEVLKCLDLSGCSNITKFPQVSGNIRELFLSETAIEEVPSSVEFLTRLVTLDMSYCERLSSLPITISKLKSLYTLDLTFCSKLKSFPEILEPMENLCCLYLSGTAIKEIPSSVENLICLKVLKIHDCKNLMSLPSSIHNLRNLREFDASKTDGCNCFQWLPMVGLCSLEILSLCSCYMLTVPDALSSLTSLIHLDLSGSDFEKLPANIKQLYKLKCLKLRYCKRLCYLPELPLSLNFIEANDCESLASLSSRSENIFLSLNLVNCIKLDPKASSKIMQDTQLKIQSGMVSHRVQIMLSGSEIPKWFCHQSIGSSRAIQLPSNCSPFMGITFSVVFASKDDPRILNLNSLRDHPIHNFRCICQAKVNGQTVSKFIFDSGTRDDLYFLKSDHFLLWYEPQISFWDCWSGKCSGYIEALFEFYPNAIKGCKVKK